MISYMPNRPKAPWDPIDIFAPSELRNLVFESHMDYRRRTGDKSKYSFDLISNVIETYKNLSFSPDSLIAPSSLRDSSSTDPMSLHDPSPPPSITTLHDVARDVLRNQFIDFGDPDHLALIRLSGWNVYILGTKVKIIPPNKVILEPGANPVELCLAHQLWFIQSRARYFRHDSPPIRTYEEIVELATSAPPAT